MTKAASAPQLTTSSDKASWIKNATSYNLLTNTAAIEEDSTLAPLVKLDEQYYQW